MVMRRHKPGEEPNNIALVGASQPAHSSPNPVPRPNIPATREPPPLEFVPPWPDWTGHPTLLLVDDEKDFLQATRLHWETHYRENFTLHTLDPDDGDPVTWIKKRLDGKKPLDAVYLDRNMPSRYGHGEDILRRLRQEVPASRYLPVVIVTAYRIGQTEDAATALAAGAQRFMYKRSPTFLFEAALAVGQLRDAAEDQMWIELTQEVAKQVAYREFPETIMGWITDFFQTHFNATDCRGRVLERDGALRSFVDLPEQGDGAPTRIPPEEIPEFMRELLSGGKPVYRTDCLSPSQFEKYRDHRVLAAALTYGQQPLGTLTVYRPPTGRPFRPKDEHFLLHLAMQLGALIGSEREQRESRERQTELVEFIRTVGEQDDEEVILERLIERLHRDIQESNDREAKTTIRLLRQGTGEIPRREHRGIPTQEELEWTRDKIIYNKSAVHAHVIDSRKSYRSEGGIIPEEPFLATVAGIHSFLTVPLLAPGLCLGAVNLEHRRTDYYSGEDQAYTEALCRVAAEFLLRVRARKFQIGLLKLVNLLARPPEGQEDLLSQAVRLLSRFTGFVRLFYLEPVPGNPDAPWRALHVYLPDGKQADGEEVERWQEHVERNWVETLAYKVIIDPSGEIRYTEEPGKVVETTPGTNVAANARAVLPIFSLDSPDKPVAVLSLRFLVKGALNEFQKELLEHFGAFLGELIIREREIRRMFDEVYVARVQGRVGMAFAQFRHALVSHTGAIGNALNRLRRTGGNTEYVERIQTVLDDIERSIGSAKKAAKVPEFSTTDIGAAWNGRIENMRAMAEGKGIVLVPNNGHISWETDTDLVGSIFFHLIQNAIQHCRQGNKVSMDATVVEEAIRIDIRDTGPGVAQNIIPTLFESGKTTRTDGSGFGLYFSRFLADDLGGQLEFDSQYKAGAGFRLTLPKNPHAVLAKRGRSHE
ncbi:MAG: Signal transduction histidine kinase [Candidatus Kentron sp. G]|nr:MAG: Signal transduction histidine kinase [Candidatus Kentron sp. G]VFM95663.1 MAG: Signal transduction histidine kinase [Candidatus Kentron sp. G]VFM97388.1 MAG: Signal transduction histidine kinase [Candidatus Kentron sp. G]